MLTHSYIRVLPDARREQLLADVAALIEREGGFVERDHEVRLYLARVRAER